MNFHNLFEQCLLQQLSTPLKQPDTEYHHYSFILQARRKSNEVLIEEYPKKLKPYRIIMEQLRNALETTASPFHLVLKDYIQWMVIDSTSSSSSITQIDKTKPFVILCHVLRLRNDRDDVYGYNLILYVSKAKKCYVINHVNHGNSTSDDNIRKLLSIGGGGGGGGVGGNQHNPREKLEIRSLFSIDNSSCIINLELDILRLVMSVLLCHYNKQHVSFTEVEHIMLKENQESVDCMEGILTTSLTDNLHYIRAFIQTTKLMNPLGHKFVESLLKLNKYVSHFMTQIRHLWWTSSNDEPFLPILSLMTYECRKICCHGQTIERTCFQHLLPPSTNDKEDRHWVSKIPDNFSEKEDDLSFSQPLSTYLTNYLENALIPYSVKNPYSYHSSITNFEDYNKTIEECALLESIMNDTFVERMGTPFALDKRTDISLPIKANIDVDNSNYFDTVLDPFKLTNPATTLLLLKILEEDEKNEEYEDDDDDDDDGSCYSSSTCTDDDYCV
jgi:hypothetical protein